MWVEIGYSRLDNICTEVLQAYQPYDRNTYVLLAVLYSYGFRINEIYQFDRRSIIDEKTVNIQLSKREGIRVISNDLIDNDIWVEWLSMNSWYPYSINSYEWRVKRSAPRVRANEDEVRRISHLFRYRFIWFLKDIGYSVEQVKDIIGHKNLSSTMKYYYGSLSEWVVE